MLFNSAFGSASELANDRVRFENEDYSLHVLIGAVYFEFSLAVNKERSTPPDADSAISAVELWGEIGLKLDSNVSTAFPLFVLDGFLFSRYVCCMIL